MLVQVLRQRVSTRRIARHGKGERGLNRNTLAAGNQLQPFFCVLFRLRQVAEGSFTRRHGHIPRTPRASQERCGPHTHEKEHSSSDDKLCEVSGYTIKVSGVPAPASSMTG